MPVILDFLIERIEAGMPLYQAAAEYGGPIDDLGGGKFRAADAAGNATKLLAGGEKVPRVPATLAALEACASVTLVCERAGCGALEATHGHEPPLGAHDEPMHLDQPISVSSESSCDEHGAATHTHARKHTTCQKGQHG